MKLLEYLFLTFGAKTDIKYSKLSLIFVSSSPDGLPKYIYKRRRMYPGRTPIGKERYVLLTFMWPMSMLTVFLIFKTASIQILHFIEH